MYLIPTHYLHAEPARPEVRVNVRGPIFYLAAKLPPTLGPFRTRSNPTLAQP